MSIPFIDSISATLFTKNDVPFLLVPTKAASFWLGRIISYIFSAWYWFSSFSSVGNSLSFDSLRFSKTFVYCSSISSFSNPGNTTSSSSFSFISAGCFSTFSSSSNPGNTTTSSSSFSSSTSSGMLSSTTFFGLPLFLFGCSTTTDSPASFLGLPLPLFTGCIISSSSTFSSSGSILVFIVFLVKIFFLFTPIVDGITTGSLGLLLLLFSNNISLVPALFLVFSILTWSDILLL